MKLRMESREVYYLQDNPPRVRQADLKGLLVKARQSPRKRARICLHQDLKDRIHEMIVAVLSSGYLAPHRHLSKGESYHVIQGEADLILFDKRGQIAHVVPMGEPASGKTFVCRVPQNQYHTFHVRSKSFVFHEVTKGPFHRHQTLLAPWAPDETNSRAVDEYKMRISRDLQRYH